MFKSEIWTVAKSGGCVKMGGMKHPETICTLATSPLSISREVHQRACAIAKVPQMIEELEALVFLEKTAMSKKQIRLQIARAKDLLAEIELD